MPNEIIPNKINDWKVNCCPFDLFNKRKKTCCIHFYYQTTKVFQYKLASHQQSILIEMQHCNDFIPYFADYEEKREVNGNSSIAYCL